MTTKDMTQTEVSAASRFLHPTYQSRTRRTPLPGHAKYETRLLDLSEASVHRNFDPYLDIDWDDPKLAIFPGDPRWVLSKFDPIGKHPWYHALPLDKQIEVGMWRQANIAKVGLQFESVLVRGLLQYTMSVPNGSREFRYCTHEAKEECNHMMMFQEFVNRVGADVPGARWSFRRLSRLLPLVSTLSPLVFFMGVLGGEEPIDHVQKQFLRDPEGQHPAMISVMQLHVAEEARHISFAHELLEHRVPGRGRFPRLLLSLMLPIVMRVLYGAIMVPPSSFRRKFGIGYFTFKRIYWFNAEWRATRREVFADVRQLAVSANLNNPLARLAWRVLLLSGRVSRYRSEPVYTAA